MKRVLTSPMWTWVVVFMALVCLVAGNQQIQTVHSEQERLEAATNLAASFQRLEQSLWNLETTLLVELKEATPEVRARISEDTRQIREALEETKAWPYADSDVHGALLRLETVVILLERHAQSPVEDAAGKTRIALQEVRSVTSRIWKSYGEIAHQIADRWQQVNILVLASCIMAAFLGLTLRAFHRDLMERKDAERALKQSEERYRRLVEVSPDAILVHREGKILFVNRAGIALLGAGGAEELLGTEMKELVPGDESWGEAKPKLEGRVARDFKLRRRDGHFIDVEAVATSFTYQDSPAVQMMIRDVTELRQQSEKLEASEKRFRSLFENVAEGVYQSSVEGKILEANPALVAMLGYDSLEELRCLDIVRDLYVDPAERNTAELLRTGDGQIQSHELRLRRKDGSIISVLENGRAVMRPDGSIAYYEGTLTDISQLKQAEETLKQARDQALHVSKLKSEFLANVSHEIRTPMNGVIGMADLLSETTLSTEQREYADAVRRSAQYLLNIINDILDFSKIEAGRMELESIDFDLRESVEDVIELLADKAQEKGLDLFANIDPKLPSRFLGDPYRIQQVITNLVGNAIKFTPAGEVILRLRFLEANDRAGAPTVAIEVEDSGIGVSPEMRDKLFQPFTQGDGSTTRRFGGTGLGLAISRQLVELMGGQISMRPGALAGSVFRFELPLPVSPAAFALDVPLAGVPEQKPRTALLAVTHPERRSIYKTFLEPFGFTVEFAEDSQEVLTRSAAAMRSEHSYALVLCDQKLRDGTAVELSLAMRAQGLQPEKCLVRLVHWRERTLERMNDECFAWTLPEPCRRAQFLSAVDAVLSGLQSGDSLQQLQFHLQKAEIAARAPQVSRILIAEDNAINQRVALRMLEKLGVEADVVENGLLAVEAVRTGAYDLVFMDCQMPEMDGFAATGALRALEADEVIRRLPIIAMTAHAMQGDRERCIDAGMDDYIAKPISRNGLDAMLQKWLPGYSASSTELIASDVQKA